MVEDLVLRLSVRAPFDGGALLVWLAARAVPGVEEVDGEVYRRSLRLAHGPGVAELTMEDVGVRCRLWLEDRRDGTTAEQLCRRLLDLDADPAAVAEHLGRDPLIGALVRPPPACGCPAASTAPSLPCAPSWASRSRWPPRAPPPGASWPSTARRSRARAAP